MKTNAWLGLGLVILFLVGLQLRQGLPGIRSEVHLDRSQPLIGNMGTEHYNVAIRQATARGPAHYRINLKFPSSTYYHADGTVERRGWSEPIVGDLSLEQLDEVLDYLQRQGVNRLPQPTDPSGSVRGGYLILSCLNTRIKKFCPSEEMQALLAGAPHLGPEIQEAQRRVLERLESDARPEREPGAY